VDVIVATALQIVDDEGAEALTLRTLAQRLGSGTATLYRHFANRAELIARVVDRVLGEVELDAAVPSPFSWQETCLHAAQAIFEVLSRHKNVAPLLVGQVPMGPNAMLHRERLIAILLDNGFPPRLAAMAYTTLAHYVLGFAMQLQPDRSVEAPDDVQVSASFRGSQFPATSAVADYLPTPLNVEFAFGAELIVRGLGELRERPNASDRRKP
jgi:AcrR family transcriptional regulator